MAFLGKRELKKILPDCIEGYAEGHLDNIAYELSLGSEVYLTDSSSGKKEILNETNCQVIIHPGQFALLITAETVRIPANNIAFISIKFTQKIKGLVNVSGFHVDPGYHGKIIFSVYNAGPAPIILDKGKPYFMIWFSELTSISDYYAGKNQNQTNISAEQISALKGKLASPNVLQDQINSNKHSLERIFWAFGIAIALAVGITVKQYHDSSRIREAYEAGLKQQSVEAEVERMLTSPLMRPFIRKEVDSIMRSKLVSLNSADTR